MPEGQGVSIRLDGELVGIHAMALQARNRQTTQASRVIHICAQTFIQRSAGLPRLVYGVSRGEALQSKSGWALLACDSASDASAR
jgi:hypothetical protein